MSRSKETERQPNNQGLSLLELLIAVIVLAIVVAPFLNSFIISAKANNRAAEAHRATAAAQNIMEGLKADTIENIAWQMAYPDKGFHILPTGAVQGNLGDNVFTVSRTAGTGGTVYIKSTTIEEFRDSHPDEDEKTLKEDFTALDDGTDGGTRHNSIFSVDAGESYEFIPQKDGKYYFAMKGIRTQGSTFDALAVLDSSKYRAGGTASEKYNDMDTVNIIGMDASRDAIFVQEVNLDADAVTELQALVDPTGIVSVTKNNVSREITVSIEVTGGDKPIHKVKVKYVYTHMNTGTTWGEDKGYTIYDNSETGQALRAMYLYYMPWYSAKPGNGITDTIIIDNDFSNGNSLPAELYIVKQEHGDLGELSSNESNYQMSLKILDNSGAGLNEAAHSTLRANLEYNLYTVHLPIPGSTLPPPSIRYYLNNVPMDTDLKKKEKLKLADNMTDNKKEDRIYEIKVSIYEDGAADKNYPEEDKLTELTGERND